jgi:hypothetical protein
MESVERLLPNGFHDGELRQMSVDYASGTLCFEIDFWIGDMDQERREIYRSGRVTITGLNFVVIDVPQTSSGPIAEELTIDGGVGQPESSPLRLPPIPPGSFLYWLFVDEWNSFIRFSGQSAKLEWLAAAYDGKQ